MKLRDMNKDERSLLIYLETCMVDNRGRVDQRKLNDDDRHIMEIWKQTGFIFTGRIRIDNYMTSMGANWVELSPEAWTLAHEERQARSVRMLSNRVWRKTSEEPVE